MTFIAKVKSWLLKKISKFLILLVIKTCRLTVEGEAVVRKLGGKRIPLIFLFWHRHIFVVIYQFRRSGARPLISLSSDGEIVSQMAEEFGMNPIRGSSSRGGARAFLELVHSIQNEKGAVLITADGPKGPARQLKDGVIQLAKKTGAAVVPISWYGSRVKILTKTWDRFLIPKPFSRICFYFGKPFVPAENENRDQVRIQLQEALNDLENLAQTHCK